MSIQAISAVWKYSRQKSNSLLVLLGIADFTNTEGDAWPSGKTLAKKVRMCKRTVQRHVRALEKAGELEVRQNQGRRGSNIYRIRLLEIESNKTDAHVTRDGGVAQRVSPVSPTDGSSVTQSVSKPLKESTPIVPTGDEIDFWTKACFECFDQLPHPLPRHVSRALAQAIPSLDKKNADSLRKFYRYEELNSKEPPYNSRRHSPERLILDLQRQLGLAVQEYSPPPPPKPPPEYSFTIEEVWQYLREEYDDCPLPRSLAELDTCQWDGIRSEICEAMRIKNQKKAP
jgi:biotin operon repressor